MCVVYAFKVSKNNALDFKNVENKNKIKKQNQSQVRNIAGDFLGCALYHALAALCA